MAAQFVFQIEIDKSVSRWPNGAQVVQYVLLRHIIL